MLCKQSIKSWQLFLQRHNKVLLFNLQTSIQSQQKYQHYSLAVCITSTKAQNILDKVIPCFQSTFESDNMLLPCFTIGWKNYMYNDVQYYWCKTTLLCKVKFPQYRIIWIELRNDPDKENKEISHWTTYQQTGKKRATDPKNHKKVRTGLNNSNSCR